MRLGLSAVDKIEVAEITAAADVDVDRDRLAMDDAFERDELRAGEGMVHRARAQLLRHLGVAGAGLIADAGDEAARGLLAEAISISSWRKAPSELTCISIMRWSSSQMRPWLGAKRSRLARSWISGTQMGQVEVAESRGSLTNFGVPSFGRCAWTFIRASRAGASYGRPSFAPTNREWREGRGQQRSASVRAPSHTRKRRLGQICEISRFESEPAVVAHSVRDAEGRWALSARAARLAKTVQRNSTDDDQTLCDILPDVRHASEDEPIAHHRYDEGAHQSAPD
jgi:hypothetical protein